MSTDLRIADHDDIDPVADLVAHSFLRMPVIAYLVPDKARRWEVSRDWYRIFVEHAINGAGQVVMTQDGKGAAVWFDRTNEEVTEPYDYAKRLAALAGDNLPQFQHLDQQMDANHPHDPHWHLLFLAVHPDRWSQGLGSALMEHTHRELDARGIAAYLEATSAANRRLYHRHRYADMSPPTIAVEGDTVLHRMWRPAKNR